MAVSTKSGIKFVVSLNLRGTVSGGTSGISMTALNALHNISSNNTVTPKHFLQSSVLELKLFQEISGSSVGQTETKWTHSTVERQ